MNEVHLLPSASRLLSYMEKHGGITGYQAVVDCGCCDYRKRISEMRQSGIPIKDVWEAGHDRDGNAVRYKRYNVSSQKHD